MPIDTLKRQIKFYESTKKTCLCGQNKIESSLYGIDIPCVHRIFLGEQFSECPNIKLELNEKFSNLEIKYDIIKSDDLLITYDEEKLNKDFAVKIIKKHSKYKNKDEIIQYVDHAYCSNNDTYFISGKPVSLIQLIDEAIKLFTEKEKQRKLNKIK